LLFDSLSSRQGGGITEVFWTVVAGVAVFVFGQAVVKFVIEPWHEYRMLVGHIAHAVILYSTANANPELVSPVPIEEARRELRSLSGELWQRTYAIPLYGPISRVCWFAPTWQEIREAASGLIGLSNSLGDYRFTGDYIPKIRKGLHIYDPGAYVETKPPLRQRIAGRLRRSKNQTAI
jgi:hypothetical protein